MPTNDTPVAPSADANQPISYEEFKQLVSQFLQRCDATPRPTNAQLIQGLHMLRLGYFRISPTESHWLGSAVIALQLAEQRASELAGEV